MFLLLLFMIYLLLCLPIEDNNMYLQTKIQNFTPVKQKSKFDEKDHVSKL